MVGWQREIGARQSIVIEGRDVGTVVFPKATYKFYLDADFEERARRRITELREKGKQVDDDSLKTELKERDHKDFTRSIGPQSSRRRGRHRHDAHDGQRDGG